jgi:hypothetical protein
MMRRPSFLAGVLLALAAVVFLRRQKVSRAEHVDLYYEDGSMVSLETGAPDGERMLSVAREALRRLPT